MTLGRGLRSLRALAGALAVVAAPVLATPAPGQATDVAADPALEARVQRLAAELRCLVCQNQSLADSNAPLAVDLKNQVREQLGAGRSEAEVLSYMTARYGDFVLYRPPLKPGTLLLWGGPALLVVLGLAVLWRALGRRQPTGEHTRESASESDRLDAEQARQARALLGDAAPSSAAPAVSAAADGGGHPPRA